MDAALAAVSAGLMNPPGLELGNEVALVSRHGPDLVAQSCTMGRKKGSGVYEIRSFDGKEQLAMRAELQTFDEFQQGGRRPRFPSPGGLMHAPASGLSLRCDVVPDDFSLAGTLVLNQLLERSLETCSGSYFSITC